MERNITASFVEAFAIPLGIFDLGDLPELTLANDLIKEYSTQDHALVPGGKSSWNIDYGSILHNPKLQDLKEQIDEVVSVYGEHLGMSDLILTNSWFNVMPKGSEVLPHRHERASVSGALYINSGIGASSLYFSNPTMIYRMAEEIKNHNTVYSSSAASIEAKHGRCIVFPSWLEHGTSINDYTDRTVISFNYVNKNSIT